ncbi:hypothetical protein T265_13183, partial [Opisthorchis viverrini]
MISKDMLCIFAMANFHILLFCITSSLGGQFFSQQQFQQYHNLYRRNLVEGSVPNQPRAKYLPDLVFDERLARDARNWAERCVFKHDDDAEDGENLAASSHVSV